LRTVLTVVVLLGLLGLAAYIAITAWTSIEEVRIPAAGMAAMAGGIALSLALGGGLMYLVFWSSRHGRDDPDRKE